MTKKPLGLFETSEHLPFVFSASSAKPEVDQRIQVTVYPRIKVGWHIHCPSLIPLT
ncbi:hypothetical protein IQ268_00020 [Oculatella sp. LEGE 06141]|uniref:hypothetical protein n=1 Tax=Oculatella sp. LEGE 06141 TaxID=1828648 RepID=UPI001881C9CC|nr:hypothetical protein [Oculatella sp. LEGE 06141]MBE9176961.1 hypothetical protein [Oculatella sp. LEGE 06141]